MENLVCKIIGHSWINCTCLRCKRIRNEQHDWDGCQCRRCKQVRNEQHDWSSVNGRCRRCDRYCNHDWEQVGTRIEYCKSCGGAGWYADTGSPECGACDGLGSWEVSQFVCKICGLTM